MLHASTKKLIDRLAEMTDLAKLDWTESEDGNITYSTEGYSVSLTETPNEMVITSKDGKELERANADELAQTQNDDGASYADIVAAMTKAAARVARGTEAAISTLLAGMESIGAIEPVAETETPEEASADEAAGDALQEAPGDDTAVLTDESVSAVAEAVSTTEPQPAEDHTDAAVEADSEPQAVASSDEDTDTAIEETVEESEPALVASSYVEASDAEDRDLTASGTEQTETDIEVDDPSGDERIEEIETDSEDHVTEAVVRLADEVNQREETSLDVAAASAVGAGAIAAGLSTDGETSSDTELETSDAEPEAEADIAAANDTESTVEPYVPFGLEAPAETDIAEAAPVFVAAHETEELTPSFSDNTASDSESLVTPEPNEDATEPVSEEPVTTWAATAAIASQQLVEETPSDPPEDLELSTETPEEVQPTDHQEELVQAAADPVETVSEPATTFEPTPEPAPEAPKTYSLSGIGAGFGLGALAAKTEATGVPGPSHFGGADEEKVVIDATEDVLPEIDGKPALPAGVAPISSTLSTDSAAETTSASPNADGETDIMKPRTRFNPWD